MAYENKKYTAVVIGITIVILLWIAHLFSFFSLSNGYSYDVLMRSYSPIEASKKIIVIEMDSSYAERGDEVWLTLLKQILRHDVEQIAFAFLPEQVSEKFYQLAADSGKTVFAAKTINNLENSTLSIQLLPKTALNLKTVFGLVSTIPQQHGVYREQHSVIEANGLKLFSFEKRVAGQVLDDNEQLSETDFRVNFIGNKNRIPILAIERVLEGGLVSELVSGRTVLVGINEHAYLSQYYTPVSTEQQLTSGVMFHAFALDTLLSDRQISVVPSWSFFLIILFITGASIFLCQWMTFQTSLIVSLVTSVFYIFVSWVLLHSLYLWMPTTELLLAQWLSFALVWRHRVNQEDHSLDQVLFGLSSKLQKKIQHVSFYNTEDPWEQLIAMIDQSLNLDRFIFLERVVGDHRLKEIKSLNCSIDDIDELRRDYERMPYSTAISESKPVLLDRKYLKNVEIDEEQYLAPLIFAGEVLGFWAFTVVPKNVASKARFNALTEAFMVQISEILHYRQEWQKRKQVEGNKFWSYLRVEGGNDHLQQLNKSVILMDKRTSELHEIFNSIHTSCVFYDLFGRVLLVNKDMDVLTQEAGIRLFNLTMLEFIVEISGYSEPDARILLQTIIFDHESVSIPVKHTMMKRSFMLHIKPLHYQSEKQWDETIPDETQVFQIDGVLCELVDTTELRSFYHLKEKMYAHFHSRVYSDLSFILLALPKLDNQLYDEKEKQYTLKNVEEKVAETLETLTLVKEQMGLEIENMVTNTLLFYPVDSKESILKVVGELQDKLDSKNIKLHLKLPEIMSLVFASQQGLNTVLNTILLTLIEDTYESGDIWIEVEEKDLKSKFQIQIHNNGIGISDNILHKLEQNELNQESEILKLHFAIQNVDRWGGSLNITSNLGEGSRVELLLRCFM